MTSCYICDSGCQITPRPQEEGDHVSCPRCGIYIISDELKGQTNNSFLQSRSGLRLKLSFAARLATDRGAAPPQLTTANFKEIANNSGFPRDPMAQFDRLIESIYAGASHVGGRTDPNDTNLAWCARVGAPNRDVLVSVSKAAESDGLINFYEDLGKGTTSFQTTTAGFRYHRSLRQPTASTRAFVAMSGDASHSTFVHGILPALVDLGWQPYRPENDDTHDKPITDTIVAEIRSSGLFIADVTEDRPNVYWELGFAMGLGIPFVITCKRDATVHFDIHAYPRLEWDSEADLKKKLRDRLAARGLKKA